MTQADFSGNNRYLVLGDALVDMCGAVGFGWAGDRARLRLASSSAGAAPRAIVGALAGVICALVAAVFVFAPQLHRLKADLAARDTRFAHLPGTAAKRRSGADRPYGGPDKVLACGHVMTEGFQVPMVAYYLSTRTAYIGASAGAGGSRRGPHRT